MTETGERNSRSAKSPAAKKAKDASVERSRSRTAAILASLVDEQDSMLDIARKFGARMARVREVRAALESHREDLDWFKSHEADILDSLRSRILVHLLADSDRRFSPVDYAVLLDKARLLRGESTIVLSGLIGIIKQAEEIEIARARNLGEVVSLDQQPEPGRQGGDRRASPPPAEINATDRLRGGNE